MQRELRAEALLHHQPGDAIGVGGVVERGQLGERRTGEVRARGVTIW